MKMRAILLLGSGILILFGVPTLGVPWEASVPVPAALEEVCTPSATAEGAASIENPLSFSPLDGAILQDAGCCAQALEDCNKRCGPCGKLVFACKTQQPPVITCVGVCECRICRD
jgi:hypothetical protein